MSIADARHGIAYFLKRIWFGKRGEPIVYGSHHLRYAVGSRPVRLKYASSEDIVARNDARQIQFYLDHIKPGQFVLDVGAHYGEYAVLFGALVGAVGRVISFEPDVAAIPVLRENIALNGFEHRIAVDSRGAFDSTEQRMLFARHGNAQSSLARAGLGGAPTDEDVEHYSIGTIRLDDYLSKYSLRIPDLIKLDIEGAEINALRGAMNALRLTPTIVCELHPYAWPEFGTSFDELLRLVGDAGRTIRYLDETKRIEDGAAYGAVLIS